MAASRRCGRRVPGHSRARRPAIGRGAGSRFQNRKRHLSRVVLEPLRLACLSAMKPTGPSPSFRGLDSTSMDLSSDDCPSLAVIESHPATPCFQTMTSSQLYRARFLSSKHNAHFPARHAHLR